MSDGHTLPRLPFQSMDANGTVKSSARNSNVSAVTGHEARRPNMYDMGRNTMREWHQNLEGANGSAEGSSHISGHRALTPVQSYAPSTAIQNLAHAGAASAVPLA